MATRMACLVCGRSFEGEWQKLPECPDCAKEKRDPLRHMVEARRILRRFLRKAVVVG